LFTKVYVIEFRQLGREAKELAPSRTHILVVWGILELFGFPSIGPVLRVLDTNLRDFGEGVVPPVSMEMSCTLSSFSPLSPPLTLLGGGVVISLSPVRGLLGIPGTFLLSRFKFHLGVKT
jgi:hypothetical protein